MALSILSREDGIERAGISRRVLADARAAKDLAARFSGARYIPFPSVYPVRIRATVIIKSRPDFIVADSV